MVAYEESGTVHIGITGDQVVDIEEFKSDTRFMEVASRLSILECRLVMDDMDGEGTRITIAIQR